jgi:hypothetical protein
VTEEPALRPLEPAHEVACHFAEQIAEPAPGPIGVPAVPAAAKAAAETAKAPEAPGAAA